MGRHGDGMGQELEVWPWRVGLGPAPADDTLGHAALAFARDKIAPRALEWDQSKHFPIDVFREAAALGMGAIYVEEKFGGMLNAFRYGAPPHGGIAFGWDRICALLSGAESIRDVIAFPKSGGGYDPLTGAPAPITPQQRKEACVDSKPVPPTA